MKRYHAGISGTSTENKVTWSALNLGKTWEQVVSILNPGSVPRNIQAIALGEYRILENRRNLIVSAPTNSGKSLIGWLVLLDAIRRGKRAILLEPLRAIAREKFDELHRVEGKLAEVFGQKLQVKITTGDYRLDDEWLTAPPPLNGEIVIATPERLDAILRNPAYGQWFSSIGAVCLDEAHLIGTKKRGATMEYLITTLLSFETPPRIVFLSATLGDTSSAQEWLAPCDLIASQDRSPALYKEVIELGSDDDANQITAEIAIEILKDPNTSVLIFVYQTRSTEYLANKLNSQLGELAGETGVLPYHSKMHSSLRESAKDKFMSGSSRCMVTTTALGLGVNLPATHVILRDVTFPGVGRLGIDEITQMMGRAGRGSQTGHAFALIHPNDGWQAIELVSELIQEKSSDLVSQFAQPNFVRSGYEYSIQNVLLSANLIAAYISRYQESGRRPEDIHDFFSHSLGGKQITTQIPTTLNWLSDSSQVLVYCDEINSYHLTVLGQKAIQSMLPIEMASGIGQFIRDLISVDTSGHLLDQWQPLDHLIVLNLMHANTPSLRLFSKSLVNDIDAWIESHPRQTPLLYRNWIRGNLQSSRTNEILGSLGIISNPKAETYSDWSYKTGYMAIFKSIVLFEYGQGLTEEDIERKWSIKNFAGMEERWRDDFLWLLSGLSKLLDLRCFYFHLKETCSADLDRINHIKRSLGRMRIQALELQETIKYCSPLGPILRSIRKSSRSTIGIQTIRKLENAGISTMAELAKLNLENLTSLKIRKDLAEQIQAYCQRRMM